jgi:hypothetical protein
MIIVSLTAHQLSDAQIKELDSRLGPVVMLGLGDILPREDVGFWRQSPPIATHADRMDAERRIDRLKSALLRVKADRVLGPAGSPAVWHMTSLAIATSHPIGYSHSERVSVEDTLPNGTVVKTAQFNHREWQWL